MVSYRDPGPIEFDAIITKQDVTGASAFVAFPFDAAELFGVKGRVPVLATFDGLEYRGSLVRSDEPGHRLLVLAAVQEQTGKGPGDSVHVTVRLDTSERVVELDHDIESALKDAGRLDAFRAMSYSHQREFTGWITGAKQAETRERRIAKMLEMLAEGTRL